jgi:hypothetical protein
MVKMVAVQVPAAARKKLDRLAAEWKPGKLPPQLAK